jgi:hypothetical protein
MHKFWNNANPKKISKIMYVFQNLSSIMRGFQERILT